MSIRILQDFIKIASALNVDLTFSNLVKYKKCLIR